MTDLILLVLGEVVFRFIVLKKGRRDLIKKNEGLVCYPERRGASPNHRIG
jgi:hypothetical protein